MVLQTGRGAEEDKADVNVWEDNWDDDNVEDDFSQQLRCVRISLVAFTHQVD